MTRTVNKANDIHNVVANVSDLLRQIAKRKLARLFNCILYYTFKLSAKSVLVLSL